MLKLRHSSHRYRESQFYRRPSLEPLEDRRMLSATSELIAQVPGIKSIFHAQSDDSVYFFTDDNMLWRTDGTTEGTRQLRAFDSSDFRRPYYFNEARFAEAGDVVFFSLYATPSAKEAGFWKTDGTIEGTVLVKYFQPGLRSSSPNNLTNVDGTLFFAAGTTNLGTELWKSDGTTEGTVLVKDIVPGRLGSYPTNLTNFDGTLFFTVRAGNLGTELWKSDGTTEGTVLVEDIVPGQLGSYPNNLTNVDGTLFFAAGGIDRDPELWKSDGTSAGTVLVKDILPGRFGSLPNHLTNVDGTLFFTVGNIDRDSELWKSDGTIAGTVLVKDLQLDPDFGDYHVLLSNVDGVLFFTDSNNDSSPQLWKSDGTSEGTSKVVQFDELTSRITSLIPRENSLLIVTSFELWQISFGSTIAGTVWNDDDLDGLYGDSELGVPGVVVQLLNENGSIVATTRTNVVGRYRFVVEPEQTYSVQFTAPDGTAFTSAGGIVMLIC